MDIINIIEVKRNVGRPKIADEFKKLKNKEALRSYAKEKNKEKKTCDICNKNVSYYAFEKHKKSMKHIKNLNNIVV